MILTDVVPNKVYLYDLALVKVLCTDTQGWLRGWVNLHHTGNSSHIHLHDIERNYTFSVPVYPHNDKITIHALKECTFKIIDAKVTHLKNQVATKSIELEDLHAKLENILNAVQGES